MLRQCQSRFFAVVKSAYCYLVMTAVKKCGVFSGTGVNVGPGGDPTGRMAASGHERRQEGTGLNGLQRVRVRTGEGESGSKLKLYAESKHSSPIADSL